MRTGHKQPEKLSRGFTLLEVLLSLVLAALVTMAVAAAIDLHLRVLELGRQEVEQAQLARSLLRQIGVDLRSAVPLPPEDVSKLITVSANSTGSTTGTSKPATATKASSSGSSSSSEDTTATESTWVSGVLGSATTLQVDVSRMPRPGELPVGDAAEYAGGPTCDVKTVTYFLGGDAALSLPGDTGSSALSALAAGSTGLCRCEQICAVAAYGAQQSTVNGRVDCLAPEVIGLEFSYYDGSEWTDEWDSSEKKALPIAVEVAIALAPTGQEETSLSDQNARIYRLLVHLPASQASTSEESTSDSTETPE